MTDLQHTQRHPWLAKVFGYALLGFVRLLTGAQARWYGSPPKAEQRIYFANHQSHADLGMIWAALPEELRMAISLREMEGLSYEEIAQALDCPIGTVRSRIFRAREAISSRIKPMLERQTGKRW